jgi:hypothetical protein
MPVQCAGAFSDRLAERDADADEHTGDDLGYLNAGTDAGHHVTDDRGYAAGRDGG